MKAIGIDLGTTNSVISEYRKDTTYIIPVEGKDTVPSVVYVKDKDTIQVGKTAKSRIVIHGEKILSSTKRHIGTKWTKKIGKKKYSPVDTAKIILEHIKFNTEKQIGDKIVSVVITIPAYFNEDQRKATKEAAEKAGFKVLRLLPEPTAAAIYYGFEKEKDQTILVVDLGGGTFDVSVLEVVSNHFTVKAVGGNSQLGGDDFDLAIVDYLNLWIEEEYEKTIRADKLAQQRLKEIAEKVKIDLASAPNVEIYETDVAKGISIEIEKFTRKQYKDLIQKYLDEIIDTIRIVMSEGGLTEDEINRFVLVGGSCKHPIIKELIRENFREPYEADNLDTCVARGAAIVCHNEMQLREVTDKDIDSDKLTELVFKDVIAHSLGINVVDEEKKGFLKKKKHYYVPILKKNTHYPCKGVFLGFSQAWAPSAVIKVYRGENVELIKNTKLGKLELPISKENVDEYGVPVAAVFDLDENGMLTFTAIEMPFSKTTYKDIKALIDSRPKEGIVDYHEIERLRLKYNFNMTEVKIQI